MFKIVNTLMSLLESLSPSKADHRRLEDIISSQAHLQCQTELSAEEKLAVEILMKRNEQILIKHIQKMMEEDNANKS